MLYCRIHLPFVYFVNVFKLNVPYIYFYFFLIPLAIYQNSSLVGYILLTWFYP